METPITREGITGGGSFEKTLRSSRTVYNRPTTLSDTVAFCTMVEFHFEGPEINIATDSVCFRMETIYKSTVQKWDGYYLGKGNYALKYVPKQAETLNYRFVSDIPGVSFGEGQLVVSNQWPGKENLSDYKLGKTWFTDKSDPALYDGKIQGGKTIAKWKQEVLLDWAERWNWIR